MYMVCLLQDYQIWSIATAHPQTRAHTQKVVAHSPGTNNEEEEEEEREEGEAWGIPVTLAMIQRWVKRVDKVWIPTTPHIFL